MLYIWFLIWWVYYYIQDRIFIPRNLTFKNNRLAVSMLSLIFIFLSVNVFGASLPNNLFLIVLLIISSVLLHLIFIPVHVYIHQNSRTFKMRRLSPIMGRFTEIGFQQYMLNVLVNTIYYGYSHQILLSGLTFSVGHLPILLQSRLVIKWRLFVVVISLVGGLAVCFIISVFQYGWFCSYLLHLCFYFVLGIMTDDNDQMLP